MHRTTRTTRALAALTALAAGAVALGTAGPAAADDALHVTYDAVGSSVIAKPKSSVALGPTTLSSAINGDGSFTGALPLPPTKAAFNVIGFLPAKATVSFIPVGAVTGRLSSTPTATRVDATARYYIKLTDVTLGGVPTFVGNACQTSAPVTIPVATPTGGNFDIIAGGTVTGTYTIGQFGNCGVTTGIINQLVPGPGNTVSLALSNGRASG